RSGFLSGNNRWKSSVRSVLRQYLFSAQRQKPTLTIGDVTLSDVGLHNRSRNRARNRIHSRIWRSRDCFLSTSPTRKTAIAPFLRDAFYRTRRAVTPQ